MIFSARTAVFRALVACMFILYGAVVYGGDADSAAKPARRIKLLPVPSFGYAPETGTYIGAVCLFTLDFYKDSFTRVSNAKAEFNYTWKKQVIAEAGWNYFFKDEAWYTQGLLHYSKFPDLYFGIGENTGERSEIRYQSNRVIADVNFLRKIGNRVFAGPRMVYKSYSNIQYDTASVYYPELRDGGNMGLGYTLLKDTRNNLLNASKGVYFEWSNTFNFIDRRYMKLYLDMRGYRVLMKHITGAVRLYNEFSVGTPLFYDHALMGGDKLVRGYYYGRFRDNNLSTLQAEARIHLAGRFGITVFGGGTKVYGDFSRFSLNNVKPNYGAGLRFLIDRKSNINLRFDYAAGKGGQDGFYIAFGESF